MPVTLYRRARSGLARGNISNRCRIRRKIGRSSALPHLSAPKLQACFKGIEFQSERRQRQSMLVREGGAAVGQP